MASNNPYADLGAQPIEEVETDFSDLGAEPVEEPATPEAPVPPDFADLGAEPVQEDERDTPGFFETILKGFKDRKAAEDQQAQEQAAIEAQAAATPPDMGVRAFVPDTELKASPEAKKGFSGFMESLKKFYRPDLTKQQMIDEMSREYALDPKEVEDNFDELARKKAQATGVATYPTNEEFLNALMIGALPLSASVAGPLAVAKGLAAYTGVKEASERVVLPAARAVIQALQGDPVQYEVTRFREAFPDVGPVRDMADLSEFVIYGIGAKNAIKAMESPRMAAELAGLRFRILKALGVKQETGLVPLTDAQIKEAFGDQAWKYLSKEGLAKWKAEELSKRGTVETATTAGEGQPEVKLEPSGKKGLSTPAGEIVKQPGEIVKQPGEIVKQPGEIVKQPGEIVPPGGPIVSPEGGNVSPVAPEVLKELGAVAESQESQSVSKPIKTEQKLAPGETSQTTPSGEVPPKKQGDAQIQGLPIKIEHPAGTTRTGKSADGEEWSQVMANDYGYIKSTTGKDGEQVDVFLGPARDTAPSVFVVDQVKPETGKFDEHKAMIGFNTEAEAKAAYLSNYPKDFKGFGGIKEMPVKEFKTWVDSNAVKKPASQAPLKAAASRGAAFQRPPADDLTFTPTKEGSRLFNITNAKGERVGEVGYSVLDGENAFIEDIQIDEKVRRQGYGRRTIEKILAEPGIERITGQSANDESTAFWKKMGAKDTGGGEFEIRKSKSKKPKIERVKKKAPDESKRTGTAGSRGGGAAFSKPFEGSEPSSRGGKWQPDVEPKDKMAKLHKFFGGMEYVRAMEMPELVRLAKQLYGAPPQVVKKTGTALGRFMYAIGQRQAKIKLVAEIFKDPELAAGVIAHEIGHGIDWLPDYTLKRGNVLGRIASLHDFRKEILPDEPGGTGELTEKDKARLRREAEKKVGKPPAVETELDPKAVLDIFNTVEGAEKNPAVAEYIKRLNTEEKKSIIKSAMEAARKGEKITIKEVQKFNADYAANREAVRKAYEDLVREEIKKRKLFTEDMVREELKALTKWWHPFDEAKVPASYISYRYSAPELYAEFLSVLLNAPAKAQEMAPNFFRGFFNYLDAKPEVKQRFFEIQELLNDPAKALKRREEDIVKMFEKSRDTFSNLLAQKTAARKNLRFLLKYHFVDRNVGILAARNKAAKAGKLINPEDDPKYLLEENSMMGSFVKSYLDDFNVIYEDIRKAGFDFDKDFGQYLFLKRVMGDRSELANPLGQNPETAARQLEVMKERLGSKFDELEAFVGRARAWFKDINLKLAEDVLSPEQIRMVNENNDYAPFRVTKYLKEYASARFMHQVGTLNDIENPAASLVFKGVAMLRMYKRNAVEKKIANFLLQNNEAESAVVKTFDKQVHVKEKDDLEVIKWREKGKWRAAYVDPYIADSFKYDDSGLLQSVGEVFGKVLLNNVLFRPVYITFNLGFQSYNLMRDFQRFWKNTPNLTFPAAIKNYFKAGGPAVRRVKGDFDPLIQQMEREGALNITMNDMIMGETKEDTEITAILTKYGILNPPKKTHPLLRPLVKLLDAIKFGGDVIETIPKVAGFYALQNMKPSERAQYIRNYIGTPNWKRRGKMYPLYNNIFLFSNIIKEGIRSDYEAAFKNPKTRAGYWWKTIKIGIIPKILMWLGAAGVFGKAIQDNYEKQTEYDKTNYITIPISEDERGKALYARIPMDETTRLTAGLFWKIMTQEEPQDLAAFTGGQLPSVSPMLEIMTTWGEYLTGGNPRDNFRNQEILTRDEAAAGGMESLEPMLRWTANQSGLVHMDIRDRLKDETLLERTIAFTPVVNRWLRLSDYGAVEKLRKPLEEQQASEARARLERKEKIRAAIREGKTVQELMNELRIPYKDRKDFVQKFKKEAEKPTSDPPGRALRSATSNEQKLKILETLNDDYPTARDYRRALAGYYRDKQISLPVLNEAVRRYNKQKQKGGEA